MFFTIEGNFATGLPQAVLGPAGVLPQVLLGHVHDLQPHQAVVIGRGTLHHCGNEFVLSGN